MKRLDEQFGLELRSLPGKIFNLIKDVPVLDYTEAFYAESVPANAIVYGDEVPTIDAVTLIISRSVNQFVQSSPSRKFYYELALSGLMVNAPDKFAANMPSIMIADKSEFHTIDLPFTSSFDKEKIKVALESLFSTNANLFAHAGSIRLIVNEMLLNALYHGPIDAMGKHLFVDVPRNKHVVFPDQKVGHITLSFNHEYLVISCQDPFGSILRDEVVKCLRAGFHHDGADVTDRPEGRGGGIGIKSIIESSSGFGVVAQKGVSTVVFCTLPLGRGQRFSRGVPKNFHFSFK